MRNNANTKEIYGNNIISAIASVLVALGYLQFFWFMGEIDDIGTGNFDWLSAVYVVFLEMPKLTYDLIPFATLIGSMIAMGDLADSNELIAIRVAGGSKGDFAKRSFEALPCWCICSCIRRVNCSFLGGKGYPP